MPTGAANLLSQGATSPAVSSHTVETNPLSTSSATTREASGDSFESTPKTSGYKFDFSSTRLVKRIQDFIDTPFDFNNLQESSIHLELPFSGGKFAFQTHTHVPAQVKVKPGTKIILDIETCVKDGLACIKTCHVKFTKPVTLYNPASALSPATGHPACSTGQKINCVSSKLMA